MRHRGSIAGIQIESDCDFVVYSPSVRMVSECTNLDNAKRTLQSKLAEANQCNMISDLGVFRWSEGRWVPAISPYDIQEWELKRNPSRAIRYP
jgi:hypothetical protein